MLLTYTLTMTERPERALASAWSAVKPGGLLAVADFAAPRGWLHSLAVRTFFARCRVRPARPDFARILGTSADFVVDTEESGSFPFVPLLRCPYYVTVVRKLHDKQD